MFTLEESALLGRMLRVVGWLTVCLAVATAAYVAYRYVERPQGIARHHSAPSPHAHHS
jgi:hypothetical protein